jgi:hypothetical protein
MPRNQEDKNSLIKTAFPKATLKRIVTKHKIQDKTRISEEGLKQLSETLDELSGWIILESEQLTTILTVFLAGLITTTGYTTKTALQKLSET